MVFRNVNLGIYNPNRSAKNEGMCDTDGKLPFWKEVSERNARMRCLQRRRKKLHGIALSTTLKRLMVLLCWALDGSSGAESFHSYLFSSSANLETAPGPPFRKDISERNLDIIRADQRRMSDEYVSACQAAFRKEVSERLANHFLAEYGNDNNTPIPITMPTANKTTKHVPKSSATLTMLPPRLARFAQSR